jgi:hypothetical protein
MRKLFILLFILVSLCLVAYTAWCVPLAPPKQKGGMTLNKLSFQFGFNLIAQAYGG